MQDPQLGRFWTTDPMAEKFFPLSPYSYVANNPIMLNDPSGKDWSISVDQDKKGVTHYHISFTGAVFDNTFDHKGRANELAGSIQQQFGKLFNVPNSKDGFTIDAKAEIRSIDNKKDLAANETLFSVENQNNDNFKSDPGSVILAKAINGKEILINERVIGDMIDDNNVKTLSHEIGHTGGLKHPKMDYLFHWGQGGYEHKFWSGPTAYLEGTNNFMEQGTIKSPTGPTKEQVSRIYSLYTSGKLNKKDIQPVSIW